MLLQKPASSLRHYTDYLHLRLCANQPISPKFQSEHFWKFPSNMYVDISSTHHTTSEESPLQRIILWKTGWLQLNNNQKLMNLYINLRSVWNSKSPLVNFLDSQISHRRNSKLVYKCNLGYRTILET